MCNNGYTHLKKMTMSVFPFLKCGDAYVCDSIGYVELRDTLDLYHVSLCQKCEKVNKFFPLTENPTNLSERKDTR